LQKNPQPTDDERDGDGRFRRLFSRFSPRRAGEWGADFGRFWWTLAALNLRKSISRARRGRAPCQNPSDSGRAWETGCDAVANWNDPARFRRVCPLLRRLPDGAWRCSVDSGQVRPFWGRAAGYWGGAGAAAYLGATLAVFLFLRTVGYPVHYGSIAWPPAWHQVREARGRYFFAKAEQALRENRPVPALMWLAQSYELDPANYSAGRVLAQLWEAGGIDYSNRLYRRLMRDHPEERTATAQAWFTALLVHGDFPTIETLARDQLAADPPHATAWLNALLFASRRTGGQAALSEASKDPALPPYFRQICAWELRLRTASREDKRRILTEPLHTSAVAPYVVYYRIERLLDAGLADEALLQLNQFRGGLSARDRVSLELEAYWALGWRNFLFGETDQLLAGPPSAPLVEVLSAHLIRHPDPALLAKVCTAVTQRPLPLDGEAAGAYASLFCAAGAAGDWVRLGLLASEIQRVTASRCPALATVEAYFRGDFRVNPVERYLPALSILPIEVDYALFDFSDRRRITPKPATAAAIPTITAP
jgi:hypothetical protein